MLLPHNFNIPIQTLALSKRDISIDILRLDKVHPIVSGNKYFKLKYFLEEANLINKNQLLTYGGAYSNHIAATAEAAHLLGLQATGIIRGLEPPKWSHTLKEAAQRGMQLVFVNHVEYNSLKRKRAEQLPAPFNSMYVIPEGGYGPTGAAGAAEILNLVSKPEQYTHIIAAVGTGTTLAGIHQAASSRQKICGFSSMKNNTGLMEELQHLTEKATTNLEIIHDYHFGGYAKQSIELTDWMNHFDRLYHIPLDFVYTGKMMYGLMNMIEKDLFPPEAKLLVVHTGGLQGNKSLPEGTLIY